MKTTPVHLTGSISPAASMAWTRLIKTSASVGTPPLRVRFREVSGRVRPAFRKLAPCPRRAVNALTNSSVRLGIRGDNAWGPEHVLLIGRTQPAFEPGRIIALAMETDLTEWLSADSSEGHLTTRLRLVGVGNSTTLIRRVLLLVYTDYWK